MSGDEHRERDHQDREEKRVAQGAKAYQGALSPATDPAGGPAGLVSEGDLM